MEPKQDAREQTGTELQSVQEPAPPRRTGICRRDYYAAVCQGGHN